MGDNPTAGIEQVLGKLVELLTAKKDDISSSSKEIVPHIETFKKLELTPNDIKLEGIPNYLAWSRRALRLLKAKGLEGYVNGKSAEPIDKTSIEWRAWDATNSLVAAWLLSSMSPAIAASMDTITSAAEIWQTVSKMYSGVGNVMLWAETEDRISNLKQGELSLMDYVAELKRLWADLDHYDPIELPHSDCVAWVKKRIEKGRVLKFLRGLNSEFEARRASMFHQPALPSLEEAIAAMAQEEMRLKVTKGNDSPPPSPAFVVTSSQETRICYNCGEKGHLSRDCVQPPKSIRGRGRASDRGAHVPRGGGGRGGRRGYGYRANFATTGEGKSELVAITAVELEELRKQNKEKESKSNDHEQTTSDNVANFVYSSSGEEDWKMTWDWSST